MKNLNSIKQIIILLISFTSVLAQSGVDREKNNYQPIDINTKAQELGINIIGFAPRMNN